MSTYITVHYYFIPVLLVGPRPANLNELCGGGLEGGGGPNVGCQS